MLATSTAKDIYVGGVGPIQSGTIRGRIPESSAPKIPMPADALRSSATNGENDKDRPALPFAMPPIRPSASSSDYESFAP